MPSALKSASRELIAFPSRLQFNPLAAPRGRFQDSGSNTRIEFYRGNLETVATLRREVLKLAVADAVANAKAAAGVAKLTTKDIVTITDQNFNGPWAGAAGLPSGTGRGEVLGDMELTVQVSVTFNY